MIPPRLPPPERKKLPLWDIIATAVVVFVCAVVVRNILINMSLSGISPGFGFLWQNAGFDVSEALIPYSAEAAYGRVIIVGLLNTLLLAAVSLVMATLCGLLIGLTAVGPSPVGRAAAHGYVEMFRNLPKLLILLVLFVAAVNGLPHVRSAVGFGGFYLSNRALYIPAPIMTPQLWLVATAQAFAIIVALRLQHRLKRQRITTGKAMPYAPVVPIVIGTLPVFLAWVLGVELLWSIPELKGFDFNGGLRLSLQFTVIALALALYHGAQIGEVIRGGIEAIPKGQSEAAAALGLSPRQAMRFILLPQVIRIILPSMNNQYVNLIKNTSVAIAVGYSDLMSVANTVINQSFRPLEMMLITMGLYLVICLGVTTALNRLNARLRLVQR